jgi:hypothetical protein
MVADGLARSFCALGFPRLRPGLVGKGKVERFEVLVFRLVARGLVEVEEGCRYANRERCDVVSKVVKTNGLVVALGWWTVTKNVCISAAKVSGREQSYVGSISCFKRRRRDIASS